MFSPLARGKASWDGDLQCETYSDQTVRHELLFFFCSLRFCVYCDSYFTANAWIHERQKIAMSTKRESWKYLNFNLDKNIDRLIKRRNNAEGLFLKQLIAAVCHREEIPSLLPDLSNLARWMFRISAKFLLRLSRSFLFIDVRILFPCSWISLFEGSREAKYYCYIRGTANIILQSDPLTEKKGVQI